MKSLNISGFEKNYKEIKPSFYVGAYGITSRNKIL